MAGLSVELRRWPSVVQGHDDLLATGPLQDIEDAGYHWVVFVAGRDPVGQGQMAKRE